MALFEGRKVKQTCTLGRNNLYLYWGGILSTELGKWLVPRTENKSQYVKRWFMDENKYWEKQLKNPFTIVIQGTAFHVCDEKATGFRGFGGAKFKIKILETNLAYDKDEIIETTNLWHLGKVPSSLNVKNNAELTEDSPTKLNLEE